MFDNTKLLNILKQTLCYCENEDWAGYDPFDGLNSQAWFPNGNKLYRQMWLQFHKRSPVNFRVALGIPKSRNPKAIGLFASGLTNLYRKNSKDKYLFLVQELLEWLENVQNDGGWGYNFDWQSRSFFVPKDTPNMIATVFVANGFLDAFDVTKSKKYLRIGLAAARFILNKLNIHNEKNDICFSYTPLDYSRIHNVNLLGAALLSRLYRHSKEMLFLDYAKKAVSFSIRRQHDDGSWFYGMDRNQEWIDGFHTGYNLVAIKKYMDYSNDYTQEKSLANGYKYYKDNLFDGGWFPKYYHDGKYPIDIHNISQAIITLCEFGDLELAQRVIDWTIRHMWSEKGYFYYQRHRFITNKIPYMRWSQAWMFLAMTKFLSKCERVS